jgi:hypothetical protein
MGLTAGLLWLVFYWRPDWKLKLTSIASQLDQADFILLEVKRD